jgi:hypothetical protein
VDSNFRGSDVDHALAAGHILGGIFGGLFPLFGHTLYARLGNPVANAVLAGILGVWVIGWFSGMLFLK